MKLLGLLARFAGHRETRVEVEGDATVLDLLLLLSERYGPAFADAIFRAPREVHTHLRVFLDENEAVAADRVAPAGARAAAVALLVVPVFEGGSP